MPCIIHTHLKLSMTITMHTHSYEILITFITLILHDRPARPHNHINNHYNIMKAHKATIHTKALKAQTYWLHAQPIPSTQSQGLVYTSITSHKWKLESLYQAFK